MAVWARDGGVTLATGRARTQVAVRGCSLPFRTRLTGEALRALGAAPVGMPVPQVPESLSQGVLDGAVVPWEVVPSIKLHELVRNHTEIPGSPTFYVATNILAMNRAKYEALPPDLQRVLDANSGQAGAEMAAKPWDEQGPVVEQMARRRGNQITVITEEEKARWVAATKPVVDQWQAGTRERGFDGAALLEEARALVAKHGQGVA